MFPFLLSTGLPLSDGCRERRPTISKGATRRSGARSDSIIKNIAGYKLGRNYMGTFGYPKNFVIAENENETPWEPYHVEHGFKKDDRP